jgi:tripartite motif-containing protein 71
MSMKQKRWRGIALLMTCLVGYGLLSGCDGNGGCGSGSSSVGGGISRTSHYYATDRSAGRLIQMDDLDGSGWNELLGKRGPNAFFDPKVIAVDAQGRIYVVDGGTSDRIGVVRIDDMYGRNLVRFGVQGSGVNQFFGPNDVFFDSQSRIYVADDGNNRIVRFDDMTGRNWTTLGSRGSGVGQFDQPSSVSVDGQGRIYVADSNNGRIVRMDDMSGAGWTTTPPGMVTQPHYVRLDGSGRIYISDLTAHGPQLVRMDDLTGHGRVTYGGTASIHLSFDRIFVTPGGKIDVIIASAAPASLIRIDDMTGAGKTAFQGDPHLSQPLNPQAVFEDASGGVYILDGLHNVVVRADDMQGTNLKVFRYLIESPFSSPGGVFLSNINGSQTLYVADTNNHRIVSLHGPEKGLDQAGWAELGGTQGSGQRQFNVPVGLFVDEHGRIYVCDSGNHRIVRMDSIDGSGWVTLGTQGSGQGQFNGPMGIWVDTHDRIYVADSHNNRIVRCDGMTGAGWVTLGSAGSGVGQFLLPEGITVDSQDHIFVADTGNDRIVQINAIDGAGWQPRGSPGSGPDQFVLPTSIFPDDVTRGIFLVIDSGNHRVVRLDGVTGNLWQPLGTQGRGVKQFESPFAISTPVRLPSSLGNFTVAVSPPSATLSAQGGAAHFTLTVSPANGYDNSVQLKVTGAPPGLSVTGPTPNSVNLAGGAATASLDVSASASLGAGPITLTITGTQGLLASSAMLTLTIQSGSPPPPGGSILFTSDLTGASGQSKGASNIFVMDADGSHPADLTHSPQDEDDARFRRDGLEIVFSRKNGQFEDIWRMHADGTSPTMIAPGGLPAGQGSNNSNPSFSPDGTHILFLNHGATRPYRMAVMDRDGGNAHFLIPDVTADIDTSSAIYSPNGQSILFSGRLRGQDFMSINIANADGTNVHALTQPVNTDHLAPRFSLDGSKIVFENSTYNANTSFTNHDVYLMNADGSNLHPLTTDGVSDSPVFTSGGKILFTSSRNGPEEIYIMDASGAHVTRLTHSPVSDAKNNASDSR